MEGTASLSLPEELQTDRTNHDLRHAVQDPAGRGDQTIAAFLLHPRQTRQKLVGDILAQTLTCETASPRSASISVRIGCAAHACHRRPAGSASHTTPAGSAPVGASWILPRLWPMRVTSSQRPSRVDHAPPGEVIEGGAPEHSLLASGIHGDVAANAGGLERGGINRKHASPAASAASVTRLVTTPASDRMVATSGPRPRAAAAGSEPAPMRDELFGVDDRGASAVRGTGAAGITGAAATRNDGQAEFDTTRDELPPSSDSESGLSTTNGYSTRQSVASVTCDTRDMPSKRMLSRAGHFRESGAECAGCAGSAMSDRR